MSGAPRSRPGVLLRIALLLPALGTSVLVTRLALLLGITRLLARVLAVVPTLLGLCLGVHRCGNRE